MSTPQVPHDASTPCTDWDDMSEWLHRELSTMPRGALLDIGPAEYDPIVYGDDVCCAQIQVLRGRTLLIRLSTTLMDAPTALSGYSVPRVVLDRWHHDDRFDDCTHGYLMTRSASLVAGICVGWFRDRCDSPAPNVLGYSYRAPSRGAPPSDGLGGSLGESPDLFPESPQK
ncbi:MULTISPECIES: hypothetical protein [unclassified Gordonia (in: high G+C Gram-positive bacteria)]